MNNNQNSEQPAEPIEIPEDAVVITQVNWAWLWSSAPWLVVLGVGFYIGVEPVLASIVAVVIVVPRFLTWKRTAYILTDTDLVYQRGGFTGAHQYAVPLERLVDVRTRDGMFGRGLGYQAVDVMFENRAVASLTYVPAAAGVADLVRERIAPFEDQRDDDAPGFGKPPPAAAPEDEPPPESPA